MIVKAHASLRQLCSQTRPLTCATATHTFGLVLQTVSAGAVALGPAMRLGLFSVGDDGT